MSNSSSSSIRCECACVCVRVRVFVCVCSVCAVCCAHVCVYAFVCEGEGVESGGRGEGNVMCCDFVCPLLPASSSCPCVQLGVMVSVSVSVRAGGRREGGTSREMEDHIRVITLGSSNSKC